jgi:hypothetical protein
MDLLFRRVSSRTKRLMFLKGVPFYKPENINTSTFQLKENPLRVTQRIN